MTLARARLSQAVVAVAASLLAALLALAHSATPAVAEWQQDEFILGTYWDPCLSQVSAVPYSLDAVRRDLVRFYRAREAHFNLLTGTQQEANEIEPSRDGMRYALYIAARIGLRYLVSDERFRRVGEVAPFDPELAAQVTRDYVTSLDSLRRSALYGYNIADEPCFDPGSDASPCAEHPARFKAWAEALHRADPNRLVYVNLLNVRAHDERVSGLSDEAAFRNYADDRDPTRRADVLSSDDYPFTTRYGFNEQYFENLAALRRVAGERPFWVYPLCAHLEGHEDPRDAQLRFMTMCPLAYGAKGLIYFTYERPDWPEGFRVADAPVVDCDSLTEKYWSVKRLNRYIREVLGPVIMRSRHRGAYHTGVTAWRERLASDDLLASGAAPLLASASNSNLLIGLFQEIADPDT